MALDNDELLISPLMSLVVLALLNGVDLVRQGLIATARTTLQLLAVGLLLNWVFSVEQWWGIVGLLLVMSLIAGHAGSGRVERAAAGPAGGGASGGNRAGAGVKRRCHPHGATATTSSKTRPKSRNPS